MNMFPHTVTVYNVLTELDPLTLVEKTTNYITVLRGVLLDASKAANVRTSGLEGADAVNLYIPFSVNATDGVSGQEKQYVSPMEFWSMEDKSASWTLSVDGNGGKNLFIKGEVVEPALTEEQLSLKYDDVYNVTKIDSKDFGGWMAHWEVGGA